MAEDEEQEDTPEPNNAIKTYLNEYRTDSHSKHKTLITQLRKKMKKRNEKETTSSLSVNVQSDFVSTMFGENLEPDWVDSLRTHSIDFQGRATLPSTRNFQLNIIGHPNVKSDEIILLFGCVSAFPEEIYTCDFKWPLSPLQAFGIALSALDYKYACA